MKIKINKKERFDIYIKNRKTFGITQEGMKTTLLCSLISATLAIQPALGAKKEVTLSEGNPAEISENIIGADGSQDRSGNDDGEAGEDALTVNVVPGSLQNENILTINSGTSISGGEGGWAGDDDVTKMGSAGGQGGTAITGNNFTLVNSGYISGGKGGWGGYGNGGGDAGEAGIAISGDDLTITNNGSITGGNGGMPGASGYGDESGGLTGTPAVGGTAISGNNLQISNNGNITAGQGSSGAWWAVWGSSAGTGGNGGTAISGNNMEITNNNHITGGQGGDGARGGEGSVEFTTDQNINGSSGGNGGIGGTAIYGNNIKINNTGDITGGQGGTGGEGGRGGTDEYDHTDSAPLGSGGIGGIGGTGGIAISGNNMEINNYGNIIGGNGGTGGDGGDGGRSLENNKTGAGGNGGNGGNGGTAISGSDITINNHGRILPGSGGQEGESNVHFPGGVSGNRGQDCDTAISLNGGTNSLNLYAGSTIQGDIVLNSAVNNADGNFLSITNKDSASSEIKGNLSAGTGTHVSVSGADVTFSGSSVFDKDSSLNMGTGSSHLTANSMQFNNGAVLNVDTAMTIWKQNEYGLLTTSDGITGLSENNIYQHNNLLSDGAEDYVLTSLRGNGQTVKEVSSSLKWNDPSGNGYGTFDLRKGAVLELKVRLADNNAAQLSHGWDGKTLTKAGEGTLILSSQNTYTGVTDIRGGNVRMNSNSALGQTSEIRLADDTMLDMNGHSQIAGKLNNAAGSILNINGGNLTLTGGGLSAGTLIGSGSLNISGGVFAITGSTRALNATTTIAEKAMVKVLTTDGLGAGSVNTAGTLILGKADAPVMLANSQVTIAQQGTLSGSGGVAGNVTNSGTLDLRADAPGNVLTIGGNYTGNNGLLLMNTALGNDSSATDKLVIKGNASSQTRVVVINAGGTGAQTLNGIELIHVDGNADSAAFIQAGRIAAGAYDYTLGRGQGSNRDNWYLTSGKNTPFLLRALKAMQPPAPEPAPGGHDNDLRPEAGSYTANIAAANTMFVSRLYERQGPMHYTDVITGEQKETSMWMHHEGGHNRWRDGTGQLKTQGNRYVLQMGGDLAQWSRNSSDRWHLGVMAGYGNDHNNTDSVRTGYSSKGSVKGYNTGLYATWYANDETHSGAYLDSWAQYSWFDNDVKGDGLPGESWKSKGLTASLETGYAWKAGEFTGSHGSLNEWYVQPQAQVIWMGVKADEHRERNGTHVESTGDGNVRTRLGVKTWIKGHNRMNGGKSHEFRPFVEVNWLHNTRDFGTRMNGVTVHQDAASNIGEVKTGVEGQINDHLNLWGNVGVQLGDKGYSDASAMLGVKYTF
ncbi:MULTISPECIES: autotransporter outer membrane beta-barrel domain-containing protein [Escherichia]|uniref:autotransporter outer membrane beta-barrel domain-containing protein n=1 Tax=Escherichia TaxID=561 RepID=UPI000CF788C8|nr:MULTISPECIES: autotransporter outer membrane beta-barrel domain-containing protein [Escherichia]EHS3895021.1 autotransporter outer membrane beta-barrel domain-containing protein [Escherichia coli]EHS4056253.1 autotransporter outer membrane beta-barrel domain-containing protein [Escherichia coli]HDJ8493828.1 autotransporter outer membrane beta-barrel domain-containing protein [Escherichia coli]